MKTIVSEKGQITIPKAARDKLGLTAGSILEIRCENGKLIGQKKLSDSIGKWRGRGKLPVGKTTDQYLSRIRDDNRD